MLRYEWALLPYAFIFVSRPFEAAAFDAGVRGRGHVMSLEVDAGGAISAAVRGRHAQGLESEHDFEFMAHDAGDASGWGVSEHDRRVIGDILLRLNPPGADSAFAWEEEEQPWTFGLVKLTAQSAKGSLALHMLHRHGLAPLLASQAGERFNDFIRNAARSEGESELHFFVRSAEEFAEVREVRAMLENLTLSALRNLHSYDHHWSVDTWQGKVPLCSPVNPTTCILQAGASASAWELLSRHGFTKETVQSAKDTFHADIIEELNRGGTGLKGAAYTQYLTPGHTGDIAPLVKVVGSGSNAFIEGAIVWEDGGVTGGLKVPMSEDQYKQYEELPDEHRQNAFIKAELEKWIEEQTRAHKTFMRENRLKVWGAEEAEFWEMHLAYQEAVPEQTGRGVKREEPPDQEAAHITKAPTADSPRTKSGALALRLSTYVAITILFAQALALRAAAVPCHA